MRESSFEIIGVAGDVANQGGPAYGGGGLQAPIKPQVWVPYTVTGTGEHVLVVRSEQTPMALMNNVQQAVWAADPGVALMYPDSLDHTISRKLYAGPRFTADDHLQKCWADSRYGRRLQRAGVHDGAKDA